ncbi:MAG: hypothetical protein AAF220_10020 [Pseudomonadota bacterium]
MAGNSEDAAVIRQLLETAKSLKEQATIAGRAQQHQLSEAFADKARRLEEQAQSIYDLAIRT